MSEHGGALLKASAHYNIPLDQWIDLSTGISPWNYPAPAVPDDVWRCLPEDDDELNANAAAYYRCSETRCLPVPGTQWAIEQLPSLYTPGRVALPRWGYREHARHWILAGHQITYYGDQEELNGMLSANKLDHLVVINPNNPSTMRFERDLLEQYRACLPGLLLIDEAFMDCMPQYSSVDLTAVGDTLVLRSLGKFFGLAGLRLGFVIGNSRILHRLRARLTLWPVNRPARWLACKALVDRQWHAQQRIRLNTVSQQWFECIRACFPASTIRHCPLFVSVWLDPDEADLLFARAAEKGLLIRHYGAIEQAALIRIGIPSESDQKQAAQILFDVSDNLSAIR